MDGGRNKGTCWRLVELKVFSDGRHRAPSDSHRNGIPIIFVEGTIFQTIVF